MSYKEINKATGKPWTERFHTTDQDNTNDQKIRKKFAETIINLIKANNGKYKGTYEEILRAAGFDETYYGDLFNEMNRIREEYGINKERGSRRGNNPGDEYSLATNIVAQYVEENTVGFSKLAQIKNLLDAKDIDKLTKDEAVSMLKVIRLICN